MDIDKIKQGLDLPDNSRISVTKVSRGFNIRIVDSGERKKTPSFHEVMESAGHDMTRCAKCGTHSYCHAHHIIPKSAGGQDDPENGILLCMGCHVGDNGIHNSKWSILDVVGEDHLFALKKKYGVIRGDSNER